MLGKVVGFTSSPKPLEKALFSLLPGSPVPLRSIMHLPPSETPNSLKFPFPSSLLSSMGPEGQRHRRALRRRAFVERQGQRGEGEGERRKKRNRKMRKKNKRRKESIRERVEGLKGRKERESRREEGERGGGGRKRERSQR